MQAINTEEEFRQLICSSDYEFLLDCGVTKPTMMMHLTDKEKVISAVCLHHAVLGSLAELEQLRRGLQTARFSVLMEHHVSLFRQLFFHQEKAITSDFIQDLFTVTYSSPGSNNRLREEAIMMNWVSYLQDLEGSIIIISSTHLKLLI